MLDDNQQSPSAYYRRAALDSDFLLGPSMRGARFMLNYAKAEGTPRAHRIASTIVVFGASRAKPSDARYEAARAFARLASEREICCGFGGTFCVKSPEISTRVVTDQVKDIADTSADTGADTLLAATWAACSTRPAGGAARTIHVRHVAEVLADMTREVPPIGEAP